MLKITAIFLTVLILISSIGGSVDVHYCQGQIKSIAFFGKAKSCHDNEIKQTCHHSKKSDKSNNSNKKENCCHNDKHTIEKSNLDAPNPEFSNLDNFQLKFVATYFVSLSERYHNKIVLNNYREYKPPLVESDILVFYQVFRI